MTDVLGRLRSLGERRVIGLNSGTSADGIDAVLTAVTGTGATAAIRLLHARHVPFAPELRSRLLALPTAGTGEVCDLHALLGRAFAEAATGLVERAGLRHGDVHIIGSHGQTAFHHPARRAGETGATLQIGDIDVIAERTGIPVVGDFRARDVAAGGQGAPLMPYLDWVLFRGREGLVTLNLGGIANITAVHEDPERIIAFDTGPANMLLDLVAQKLSRGAATFDAGGAMAASGTVDRILLERLMRHPYVVAPPPKTTGREEFGGPFVDAMLEEQRHLKLVDVLATLTEFTARSVRSAVAEHVETDRRVTGIAVSGGGGRNSFLMSRLAKAFRPIPVRLTDASGVDGSAREGLLFALLANERLFGTPSNIPRATGARFPVCLGKLAL